MKIFYVIAASSLLIPLVFKPSLADPIVVSSAPIAVDELTWDGDCQRDGAGSSCAEPKARTSRRFVVNARRAKPEKPDLVITKQDPGGASQIFDVTSAKSLRIRFLGYRELTGEYSVNADATVSIPVLGRISVANMDAAKLERILSKRVTTVTGRKGYATVEISDYRPIFVTGVVRDSKSYAWTPRMTILHAITLAGGTSLAAVGGLNVPLSTNIEIARIEQASNKLKRSLATLARLRAERHGKTEIAKPDRLIEVAGAKEATKLIDAQLEVLQTNTKSFNSQFNTISQAIKTANTELKAIKRQEGLIKKQLKIRRLHQKELRKLAKRKLLSRTTYLDRESRMVQTEERNITTLVARARLQGRILDLQRDLLGVQQKKEGSLDKRILTLEQDIAGQEIDLKTARKAIRALTNGSDYALLGGKKRRTAFQIVRETSRGANTIKADRFTRLKPGDIVVVSR